jgi:UDP-glucose 4-epimerase
MVAPASAYGRSKLTAENDLMALAAAGFAVSLLRVPILLGSAAGPGADKLAALMKIIRRTHVIPRPAVPVRRAMLTYGGLGAAVAKVIEQRIADVVAAADPEPFNYDLVAECASALSMRTVRVPVPKAVEALMRMAVPSIGNRLFGSMELAPDFNLLTGATGYVTLRDVIQAHLSR